MLDAVRNSALFFSLSLSSIYHPPRDVYVKQLPINVATLEMEARQYHLTRQKRQLHIGGGAASHSAAGCNFGGALSKRKDGIEKRPGISRMESERPPWKDRYYFERGESVCSRVQMVLR